MRSSVATFLTIYILLLQQATTASASDPLSASHPHRVTSAKQFIIVDSDKPQLYPLFGFLPVLKTWSSQLYIAAALTLFLGVPLFLYFYLRPRHPYADWTSRLPDKVVNLLYYLEIELSAYRDLFLTEIMSLVSAPLGVGLGVAASVSQWSPFGVAMKTDQSSKSRILPRTGRAQLRRKQQASGGQSSVASTSQPVDGSANGVHNGYYPGLYNTGNSCFLNSTLQSLASLEGLQDHLARLMSLAETWDVPTPVTDALYELSLELNTPTVKRSALLPRHLTDALSNLPQTNVGSFFYAHQQQDAHELLVLLTSAIDDELNTVLAEKESMQRRQAVGLQAVMAPSVPSHYSSCMDASTSTNPFRSLIAQRTACLDCGYVEAVRHYPADELSLAVPLRSGATTVEMCLGAWNQLERVDWVCFRCSLRTTLEKVCKDEERLSAGILKPNGTAASTEAVKMNGGSYHDTGAKEMSNGSTTNGVKMSNAKRKKLKDVRRRRTALEAALTSRLSEDEVEASQLLKKADVKLERSFSSLSTKQVMIARTPKILVLHLNRSSYSASNFGASKNNAVVLFDEYVDVSAVVTNGELNVSGNLPISRSSSPARSSQRENPWIEQAAASLDTGRRQESLLPVLFRLCAIVVHYGSHSAGHYVSFRRRTMRTQKSSSTTLTDDVDQLNESQYDAWFRISDDSVSPCSIRDVLSQNPFLLFYERVNSESNPDRLSRKQLAPPHANGTVLPTGFEAYGRDEMQQTRTILRPRVVERWNTVH